MKIAICGMSGFLGGALFEMFTDEECEVIPIVRKDLYGDYISTLAEKLSGVDVVINLAGATINHSWSSGYKEEILESRTVTTQKIVDVINHMVNKPKVFVSASAVGYYSSVVGYNDEQGVLGDSFLSYVCDNWERVARRADSSVRTVIMRMGVVVSASGGAYAPILNVARKYHSVVKIGSGSEVVSWIELTDLLRLYKFVIDNKEISGVVNCVAPMPFTGAIMANLLSNKFTALIMTVPRKIVELVLGDRSEVILSGSAVYPKVALENGFKFKFIGISDYIKSL